jgi:hypothetical protein
MNEPGGASIPVRWWARRQSEQARALLDRPPVRDDGPQVLRTTVVGPRPLRVLLFGSGPLVGYGVTTRRQAVDGALAGILSRRTGRGVVVETRVRLGLPLAEAVGSLGGAGTVTYQVAVWAPRFGEELQHSQVDRSRAAVRAMFSEFRDQATIPLVVCQLPRPLGMEWRTVLRRPRVARFNDLLAEQAATVPGISVVDSGTYHPMDPRRAPDAAWHRELAGRLVPAILDAIGHGAGRPAGAGRALTTQEG